MVIVIIVIVLLIVFLGFFIKYLLSKKLLLDSFEKNNCIVDGKKGTGKDLIFQYVINHRKKKYLSNISYGGKYKNVELHQLELKPNTYENFINGEVVKVDKNNSWEGVDIYISDGGIYLPSQYDNLLHKKYPSLPIYYALSRHLYNSNVHINSQSLDRIRKALREQGETFVKAKKTIKLPFLLITKFIVYDKIRSASMNLEPFQPHKHGLIREKEMTDNKKSEFKSLYGDIKSGFIVQLKKSVKYDTRAFEKIVFKNPSSNVGQTREKWSLKQLLNSLKNKLLNKHKK